MLNLHFNCKTQRQMFLLLYCCHVCALPNSTTIVSMPKLNSINLSDTLLRITGEGKKEVKPDFVEDVYMGILYHIPDS